MTSRVDRAFAALLVVLAAGGTSARADPDGKTGLITAEEMAGLGLPDRAETGFQISRSGAYVAFVIQRPDGIAFQVRRTADGGACDAERLIPTGTIQYAWKGERTGDRLVCFHQKDGGASGIASIDPASASVRDLTPEGTLSGLVSPWKQDPRRILVSMGEAGDVHALDVETGAMQLVFRNTEGFARLFHDHDGVIRIGLKDERKVYYHRPADSAPFKRVSLEIPDTSMSPIFFFTPDNRRIHAFSNRGRDRIALVALDPGTLDEVPMYEDPRFDLINDSPVHSFRERKIAGLTLACSTGGVFFDPAWKEVHDEIRRRLPDAGLAYVDASTDGKHLLVSARSATEGSARYHWDVAGRKLTLLSRQGAWPAGIPCPTRESVAFKAGDGMDLHGVLCLPAGYKAGTRLPAIVMTHEIPWRETTPSMASAGIFDFLANRGYAVLYVDNRGCAGLGRAYRKAAEGELSGKVMGDYRDAARWLVAQGYADPKKIGIYGQDWGGFAAAWGAAAHPDLFACGASIKGGLDLKGMLPGFTGFYGELLPHEAREVEAFLQGKENLSLPGMDLKKVRNPLLFMTIDEMNIFADKEATKGFVKDLNAAGGKGLHVDVEGPLYTRENMVRYYGILEAFFARHLGGRKLSDNTEGMQ